MAEAIFEDDKRDKLRKGREREKVTLREGRVVETKRTWTPATIRPVTKAVMNVWVCENEAIQREWEEGREVRSS